MSEEQKVDNHKLAGWKRAILIAVPFVLLGLTILFMVKALLAWGPDFTRNHGDSYLTLALICTILLFAGIAMQFVWPKAINKGRRIVVVGLVFNIILAFGAVIATSVGYGVNAAKYSVYSSEYKNMTQRVREGLEYPTASSRLVTTGVTVEDFIKEFDSFAVKYSGERASSYKSVSVGKYSNYTTESFYRENGYASFAYQSVKNTSITVEVYNIYMGEEADLKAFAKKYDFADTQDLYGENYKLQYAPQYFESVWTLNGNTDASKTVKAKFDYHKDVEYLYSYKEEIKGSTAHYQMAYKGVDFLFDFTAKSIRVCYLYETAYWSVSLD